MKNVKYEEKKNQSNSNPHYLPNPAAGDGHSCRVKFWLHKQM